MWEPTRGLPRVRNMAYLTSCIISAPFLVLSAVGGNPLGGNERRGRADAAGGGIVPQRRWLRGAPLLRPRGSHRVYYQVQVRQRQCQQNGSSHLFQVQIERG